MSTDVGIVVPTLGERPGYLIQSLRSIRTAGDAHVCLVASTDFDSRTLLETGMIDQFVIDPGNGLALAIHAGISALPKEVVFINWLCDDDLLSSSSISQARKVIAEDSRIALVFGYCDYIDENGERVWSNRFGRWAALLLHFGPDLIPQPGSLIRRSHYEQVGGLNGKYKWAFDFDLYIRIKKLGRLQFVKATLSSFRWHPDSLSVQHRRRSVTEASSVRVSHLPPALRPLSILWETPVREVTFLAGLLLSSRGAKLRK